LTFTRLNQAQLANELGELADAVAKAQKTGVADDIRNVDALQSRLAALSLTTPDSFRAASSLINYSSFIREKTGAFLGASAARARDCGFIKIDDGHTAVDHIVVVFGGGATNLNGCTVRLDGLSIKNYTFVNAIVTFGGGMTRLENVRFINCLFAVSLPAQPSVQAKQFAQEILLKNVGSKPTFTTTVG